MTDLKKVIPNFNADALLGANINSFHKDPSHNRKLIEKLSGIHRSVIKIGPRTFRFAATPVRDEQGGRIGTVVEWVDRTQELAVEDEVQRIADIIGVTDEIVFQTNLLALNAAVEAARAGERGRGFAVVASEVRNLAQRSATAAKGIKALIEDSVGKVDEGSRLVDESGRTLEQIVTSVKKVSDIVAEIAAASDEQSLGIDQVNRAIHQMDEVTQQNAALVEQAAAASESMGDQAGNLNELMKFFSFEHDEETLKYMVQRDASEGFIERR